MKMGRASISFGGDIVLDRNDGTFLNIGYYVIEPDLFGNRYLIGQCIKILVHSLFTTKHVVKHETKP